jgi:hypothetical protein
MGCCFFEKANMYSKIYAAKSVKLEPNRSANPSRFTNDCICGCFALHCRQLKSSTMPTDAKESLTTGVKMFGEGMTLAVRAGAGVRICTFSLVRLFSLFFTHVWQGDDTPGACGAWVLGHFLSMFRFFFRF